MLMLPTAHHCCFSDRSAACKSLGMATHLAVDSAHKHGPSKGLDDDCSPADPQVGLSGPQHSVLFLEHHGCTCPSQVRSQPGGQKIAGGASSRVLTSQHSGPSDVLHTSPSICIPTQTAAG